MVHLEKSVRKGDREIPSGDHLRIARTGQDSRSHQFVREPGKLEPGIVVQRARMVSRSAEYPIQLRRIPVSMLVAPEGERGRSAPGCSRIRRVASAAWSSPGPERPTPPAGPARQPPPP